jgi:glycine cleavage system regulatory protein
MAQLGGQFAGILRVEIEPSASTALTTELLRLSTANLQVIAVPTKVSTQTPLLRPLRLQLVGQDRPGIIREISQILAQFRVNVEELNSECQSAPMSGETLFVASARLGVPNDLDLSVLRSALERIASDLMVDVTIETPETQAPHCAPR